MLLKMKIKKLGGEMENKTIRITENILLMSIKNLFLLVLIFMIFKMYGLGIDEKYALDIHKSAEMYSLIMVGGLYLITKGIFMIYKKLENFFDKVDLRKSQKYQLDQIEDKMLFEEEGVYEVLFELQKHKNYETEVISHKVRIRNSETIKGFLNSIYSKKECDYLVVNISSIQKIADLNEMQLPNTLNNLQEKENI